MSTTSRRNFIRSSVRFAASSGLLVPALSALLPRYSQAQSSPIKRVVFFYWPNGAVKEYWQPEQGEGPISTDKEINFILSPLQEINDKIIVCKNIFLSGVPSGGPLASARSCFTGMRNPGYGNPSVDYALANALQPTSLIDVLNLGVRTSFYNEYMISQRVNETPNERQVPENDPKAAADNLFGPISGVNPRRTEMLEVVLQDIAQLKSLDLNAAPKEKIEEYEKSITEIERQLELEINGCGIKRTQISDPYLNGETAPDFEHYQHIPTVVKAQIDNAVTALSCGVANIATLQMFKPGENVRLVNMSFDGCWEHIQAAHEIVGGAEVKRWYNEHGSYVSSHNHPYSNVGQTRWFAEQFAYLVNELDRNKILDDTLAVMISNCGDGNDNGPFNGGIVVAGGTGGALETGRIIDCNNQKTSAQLFVDIGSLMGVDLSAVNEWGSGGLLI